MKADVAADPSNKERDAQFLLSLGSAAYKAARASKKPEDFQKAITLLQASDEIEPEREREVLPRRLGVPPAASVGPDAAEDEVAATDAKAASELSPRDTRTCRPAAR